MWMAMSCRSGTLLALASLAFLAAHVGADKSFSCLTGFVSDTFCIEQGGFVDKPEFHPLVNPEEHTAKCLVNPPQCRAAYEILGDPEDDGNYTRAAALDPIGTDMMLEHIQAVGADCMNCTGDIIQGIRATAVGVLSDGILTTHAVFDESVACETMAATHCVEGYITDTFCIEQGGFVDKPEFHPLVNPEEHTAKCLINPPQCVAQYEILNDPTDGGNHTRAAILDAVGTAAVAEYVRGVGAGCIGCTGEMVMGVRATVMGVLKDATELGSSNETPPFLAVTDVMASTVGCADFNANQADPGNEESGTSRMTSTTVLALVVVSVVVAFG